MSCFKPLQGYRSKFVNPESGKRSIVFNREQGYVDMPVTVPCGRCIGCRLDYSRQWAVRCMHQAQLSKRNCFITLTYNDENLPEHGDLCKKDFQDFMKRLRYHYSPEKLQYYMCGEYGEKNGRPHYHAILFNIDFPDQSYLGKNKQGDRLYTSQTLSDIWQKGFVTIGQVTFNSAAYVSRYIMKKQKGKLSHHHYQIIDYETGEVIYTKQKEYTNSSKRPAIAADWIEKYKDDIYPKDFVTIKGKKINPPKFYDAWLEKTHEEQYLKIKARRRRQAEKSIDNTPARLQAREICLNSKLSLLTKEL